MLVGLTAVAAVVPYLLIGTGFEFFRFDFGIYRYVGILPAFVGAIFYLVCAGDFLSTTGSGPSFSAPPDKLVRGGLYRRSRNPMYLGLVLVLIGDSVLLQSSLVILYTLVVAVGVHLLDVFSEEARLRRKFGKPYEKYCLRVNRWFGRARS